MPQKQPPARTAVSLAALERTSTAGAGSTREASSAFAVESHIASPSGKANRPSDRLPIERNLAGFIRISRSGVVLAARNEFQSGRIHAVAQARGLWPVIENVTQMRITACTRNRSALHHQRV